ncbi:MAG TPA: short-chain dehydrogenase, partial [Polyangiaceae bacterium]|nr:short-chain dehydrogenase [Polyangiaceae bacterium]
GFTESLRTELLHDQSRVHVTHVLLPAINTPQFSWSRAKLPKSPQPVPPIYQPEVAADAIVFAATHRRREVWVAWPVAEALIGEAAAAGVADRYLANHGYESQETDQPLSPERPDNLYEAVPGDHGAHGEFDDKSSSFSVELWATKHRGAILVAAAAGVALAGARIARAYGSLR